MVFCWLDIDNLLITAFSSSPALFFHKFTGGDATSCAFSQLNQGHMKLANVESVLSPDAAALPFGGAFNYCVETFSATSSVPSHVERLYCFLNEYNISTPEGRENNCKLIKELESVATNEKMVCEILAKYLIKPLAGHFIVGRDTWSKWVKKDDNITWKSLGLGHEDIWHGYLDVVAVALAPKSPNVSVIAMGDPPADNTVDEESNIGESNSDIIADRESCIEVKRGETDIGPEFQVIAETICFSFVQWNRMKQQTMSIVPGILLNSSHFSIVLYDCVQDILAHSMSVNWRSKEKVSRAAIVQLWAVLHHGHHLREIPSDFVQQNNLSSGFHALAQKQEVLHRYQELASFELHNVHSKPWKQLTKEPYVFILPDDGSPSKKKTS